MKLVFRLSKSIYQAYTSTYYFLVLKRINYNLKIIVSQTSKFFNKKSFLQINKDESKQKQSVKPSVTSNA